MRLLLLLAFLTSNLYAEVQYIKKGDITPYEGYLFSVDAERKNRAELIMKDNMTTQIKLYEENEKIYERQVYMWKNVATENTERLLKMERNSFWQNSLYFTLGVVVTGAIAIGVSRGMNR
jgi:hypothetical protein